VTERSGAKVVFVLDDARVRMVPVDIGEPFGDDGFVLQSKLDPGTRVVEQPASGLTDGEQVKERTDG
jgi:multidrug efflux pump subunit AcrA (membrane-fusion protein)